MKRKSFADNLKLLKAELKGTLNSLAQKTKRTGCPITQNLINSLSAHFPDYFGNGQASGMAFLRWIRDIDQASDSMGKEDAQKLRTWLLFIWNCDPPKDRSRNVSEKALKTWNDAKQRTRGWAVRIRFDLLHSDAYKSLNYAPALKVLNFFHEQLRYEKIKGKRSGNRYRLLNGGEFSFTYTDAILRGLTRAQYSRALKELHRMGFVDFVKAGSGLQKDYSIFTLSDRWQKYGSREFLEVKFPERAKFGFQ